MKPLGTFYHHLLSVWPRWLLSLKWFSSVNITHIKEGTNRNKATQKGQEFLNGRIWRLINRSTEINVTRINIPLFTLPSHRNGHSVNTALKYLSTVLKKQLFFIRTVIQVSFSPLGIAGVSPVFGIE